MKVLIMTVSAGYGHHAAAKSLADALSDAGHQYEILDTIKCANKTLGNIVDSGYLFMTKHTPGLFGKMYYAAEGNRSARKGGGIVASLFGMVSGKIMAKIEEYKPDAILTTHVFAAQICCKLKREGKLSASIPVVGVMTDYCMHPYWEGTRLDVMVLAHEQNVAVAVERGVDPGIIRCFGIPSQKKFRTEIPKAEARRMLGLDEELFTVFVMSGSMGHGRMDKIMTSVDAIDAPFQMVCVCGSNKKMKEKLDGMTFSHKTLIVGFVDNIEVIMSAGDIIITKPGGLSTTESMIKRLPMILANPIPGPENRNHSFFVNNGAAMITSRQTSVAETLTYALKNPVHMQAMRECIEYLRKPDAGDLVVSELERLLAEKK